MVVVVVGAGNTARLPLLHTLPCPLTRQQHRHPGVAGGRPPWCELLIRSQCTDHVWNRRGSRPAL